MYYVVVDLEATCSKRYREFPMQECETIEIGAVVVNAKDWKERDHFHSFVKPVRHPILTPFCTALTGITQSQVDRALLFPKAFTEFESAVGSYEPYQFCSWGTFDKEQLMRDCQYHDIVLMNGFDPNRHVDLSAIYKRRFGRRPNRERAMSRLGIESTGRRHRGLDDARNGAQMLPYLFGVVDQTVNQGSDHEERQTRRQNS